MLKIKTTKSIYLNGAFRMVSELIMSNFVIIGFSREQIMKCYSEKMNITNVVNPYGSLMQIKSTAECST